MSDSPAVPAAWSEGMTSKALQHVKARTAEISRLADGLERSKVLMGRGLRTVLRTYLKSDKKRFEAYVADQLKLGISAAYEYVQAADAVDKFGTVLKAAGTDPLTLSTRATSQLARFTTNAEKIDDGLAVIRAEMVRAKSDGTKPFTAIGLKTTIDSLKTQKDGTSGTGESTKVAQRASKYRDAVRSEFVRSEALRQEKGPRVAFFALARLFTQWTVASGDLEASMTLLQVEWAAEDKTEAIRERRAQAKAEKQAKELGEVQIIVPEPKPEAKILPVESSKEKRTGNQKVGRASRKSDGVTRK